MSYKMNCSPTAALINSNPNPYLRSILFVLFVRSRPCIFKQGLQTSGRFFSDFFLSILNWGTGTRPTNSSRKKHINSGQVVMKELTQSIVSNYAQRQWYQNNRAWKYSGFKGICNSKRMRKHNLETNPTCYKSIVSEIYCPVCNHRSSFGS